VLFVVRSIKESMTLTGKSIVSRRPRPGKRAGWSCCRYTNLPAAVVTSVSRMSGTSVYARRLLT
jgi:hypothetical protein